MHRRTPLHVYVSKEVMTNPIELCDAVISHLIKRGLDIRLRKEFLAKFMKAPTDELKLKMIDGWVLVKDAAAFPFRKEQDAEEISTNTEITVATADTKKLGEAATMKTIDDSEEDEDESMEAEGGVPLDDSTGGEPESGAAPE